MTKYNEKKQEQLGESPGKANHRLMKDILWMLIVESNRNICFQCGKEMCRDTYSVEHKVAWLDKENPKELFFNLDNISFSHLSCNVRFAKRLNRTEEEIRELNRLKSKRRTANTPKEIQTSKRRERYLRTGK